MEDNKDTKDYKDMLMEQLEQQKIQIVEEGINPDNITYLSELIDICKDLKKIEKIDYEMEESDMYYRNRDYDYNEDERYGRRRRDARGRYMEGGQHSRGHEMLDKMSEHYGKYKNAHDDYITSGHYGAKDSSKIALQKMLESVEDFMAMLMEDAESQDEVEMVRQTAKEISMM